MFTLVIAITTCAVGALANPARLGGFKWSLDTTTAITDDENSAEFNDGFAKSEDDYGEYPDAPFYFGEEGEDARMSVSGNDDRYTMPPLAGEAEDFMHSEFVDVRIVGGGSADRYKLQDGPRNVDGKREVKRYKMPPVYSVQQLYDMKNGKGSRSEEGAIEEDDDEEDDDDE